MAWKVRAVVAKDGSVVIGTTGFKGAECMSVTKEIEKGLGHVVSDEKTPEFYLTQKQEVKQ